MLATFSINLLHLITHRDDNFIILIGQLLNFFYIIFTDEGINIGDEVQSRKCSKQRRVRTDGAFPQEVNMKKRKEYSLGSSLIRC